MNVTASGLSDLLPFLRLHKRSCFAVLALSFASALLEIFGLAAAIPLLNSSSLRESFLVIALIAVVLPSSVLLRYASDAKTIAAGTQIELDLRNRVLTSLKSSEWAHVSQVGHGQLATRLMSTTSQVANGCISILMAISSMLTGFVLSLGAIVADPILALPAVIYAPVVYFLYRRGVAESRQLQSEMLARDKSVSEETASLLNNAKGLFVSGDRELWLTGIRENLAASRSIRTMSLKFPPRLKRNVELAGIVFILLILILSSLTGRLGAALVFLVLFYRALPKIQAAQSHLAVARGQEIWIRDLAEFQSTLDASHGDAHRVHWQSSTSIDSTMVIFEDVRFDYPGERRLELPPVSFSLRRGERVAIAGPTGVGKSTVLDAVAGLLNPVAGDVTIFGVGSREEWQRNIAYVMQDPLLRSGSIRDNLLWHADASEQNVQHAVAICQLEQFIAGLPQGLETQVTLRGSTISGGQRQRIGLARAILQKPRLLILDEATSALDQQTELAILARLREEVDIYLILAVTHREQTLGLFDRVIRIAPGIGQEGLG